MMLFLVVFLITREIFHSDYVALFLATVIYLWEDGLDD